MVRARDGRGTTGLEILGVVAAVAGVVIAYLALVHDRRDDPSGARERAPYIAQVDGMCAEARRQIDALGEPPVHDTQAYSDFLERSMQIHQDFLQTWTGMPYPSADRESLIEIWNLHEALEFRTRDAILALRDGDQERANSNIDRISDVGTEMSLKQRNYGLRICPRI